ncbi:MAG TPA: hypothetical protein VG206_00715 [Terriglobia bacterium]|nr:hypothetical protein [Terriglobia bacterium]
MQNTKIKGQRYLDQKTRNRDKAASERAEFLKELEGIRTASARSL